MLRSLAREVTVSSTRSKPNEQSAKLHIVDNVTLKLPENREERQRFNSDVMHDLDNEDKEMQLYFSINVSPAGGPEFESIGEILKCNRIPYRRLFPDHLFDNLALHMVWTLAMTYLTILESIPGVVNA